MEPKQPKFTKLKSMQTVKLHAWLEARKAEAMKETAEKLAASASHDLGFPVSRGQLQTLRQEMGILIQVGRGPSKPKPLDPRIIVLAKSIQALWKAWGENAPADVLAIIDGK